MRSLLNKSILPARARLGLAVSGGIDSMVMLHACAAELSNPLTVINIDHGLRPESAAECAFVRDYCQTIGVLCRTQTVKVSKNGNIEQRARDARYKAFDGALDSGECDYILTAHTAGDNAETVLLHILRGSALRGARGIAPVNGRYLRPLLGVSRTDIEEYARAHGVPHAEDPSNEDSRYSRNFIRNEILPLLSERFDGAESSLNRFAALAAADDDYLYSLAQMPICVDGEAFLPDAVFTQAPPLCARSVTAGLKTLLNSGYESKHIGLIRGLYGKQTGRSLNIKDGVRALRVYNGVTLTREKSEQPTDFCIPFRTGNIKVPGGTIQVSSQMTDDKAQMTNNGENKHKPYLSSVICHLLSNEVICHLSSDNNTSLFLDPGKVPPGSLIRFRRDGDVFTKFGGGQKKLAKYLIDIKLDGRKRDTLPLLCCNNEVLAVIGLEISERVKLDEHSKQALKIEFISD